MELVDKLISQAESTGVTQLDEKRKGCVAVYGPQQVVASHLIERAVERFSSAFDDGNEACKFTRAAWAPGRVAYWRAHWRYNGVRATWLWVIISRFAGHEDQAITSVRRISKNMHSSPLWSACIFRGTAPNIPGWSAYILGVASELARCWYHIEGVWCCCKWRYFNWVWNHS